MKTFFITGCGSGFGLALAKRALNEGHHVVATNPTVSSWVDELQGAPDRLLALPLDVCDADQVEVATAAATMWRDVDVVVNNAGHAVFCTQEEVDIDAVRTMFDLNVLGMARVTRALMPSIRAQAGSVVNISSVAGRMVFPESGFYAATKHAVEAMSAALVQEGAEFGIQVVVVEPGAFDTGFLARAERLSPKPRHDSPYARARAEWQNAKMDALASPQNPDRVAQAILDALRREERFLRVPVGDDAQRLLGETDTRNPDRWRSKR